MYENSQTRPQKEEIEKNMFWREWIEDRFLHTIAPNLYRNYGDSIANTQHYIDISPRFGKTWTGSLVLGCFCMFFVSQKSTHSASISTI